MPTTTIAAKAHTSTFSPVFAAAVTAVTVNGVPVAFTNNGGNVVLAATLTADAEVTLTYDADNPRAGATEFRMLEIGKRLAALEDRATTTEALLLEIKSLLPQPDA